MKHYLFWLVMLLNPIPDRDMVSPYTNSDKHWMSFLKIEDLKSTSAMHRKCTLKMFYFFFLRVSERK
jgi:hypothetical protein